MYFVTAAFNVIARETILQLLRKGHTVRAMLPKEEDENDVRRTLKDFNVDTSRLTFVHGAFWDRTVMANALEGVTKVFLSSDAMPGFEDGMKGAIDLCVEAGVEHVVFVSADQAGLEAPYVLGQAFGRIEEHLKASGLPWTILQPLPFLLMQNIRAQAKLIQHTGAFSLPLNTEAVSMLDCRDISTMATVVLTQGDHIGQTYRVTGPTSLTAWEMAGELTDILGYPVRFEPVSTQKARKQMIGLKMPEWLVDDFLGLIQAPEAKFLAQPSDDFERLVGRPARSFADFTKDYSWAFSRGEKDGNIDGWVNYL